MVWTQFAIRGWWIKWLFNKTTFGSLSLAFRRVITDNAPALKWCMTLCSNHSVAHQWRPCWFSRNANLWTRSDPEGSSRSRRRVCRDVAGRASTHLSPPYFLNVKSFVFFIFSQLFSNSLYCPIYDRFITAVICKCDRRCIYSFYWMYWWGCHDEKRVTDNSAIFMQRISTCKSAFGKGYRWFPGTL